MCVSCVGDCGDKKLVRKNERVSSMMVLKKIIVSKRYPPGKIELIIIMTVAVTLRSRVSDVARKGFEKSTTAIRLQVWVRSAAITSISLKITLMEIFVNFQATSR